MINFLFRLFLTFNATSLIIVVYLVKDRVNINRLIHLPCTTPNYVSYMIYALLPVLLTYLSLLLSKGLSKSSMEAHNGKSVVKEIEHANNAYLPSYLGYFFVALSVPFDDTLIFVYVILFVFTFLSQTLYFNPLFLIFRYHFYYLTTTKDVKIFMITRKVLKDPAAIDFPSLQRINDFTFIDLGKA